MHENDQLLTSLKSRTLIRAIANPFLVNINKLEIAQKVIYKTCLLLVTIPVTWPIPFVYILTS